MKKKMTILYFGTYEETYSRNQIMIRSLKKMGHTVKECHVSLWGGKTDKTHFFKRGNETLDLLFDLVMIYPRLFIKLLRAGSYDIVFIGYLGHLDVLAAKAFQGVLGRHNKIVFDAFISLYDTMVCDRKMIRKGSFLGKLIFWLDRFSCALADIVLLDTQSHITFFEQTFGIPEKKMVKIHASADHSIFYPRSTKPDPKKFQVLFMGKYTPLHGIEHIVAAAERLQNQTDIQFVFIGKGQLYASVQSLIAKKRLRNIVLIEWVTYPTLPDYIGRADVSLGIFAKSEKADRVIPNKVFQAMAMGKPVITAKTRGVMECLTHGKDIYLCEAGDPLALSEAILTLKSDRILKESIGRNALWTFQTKLGNEAVTQALAKITE